MVVEAPISTIAMSRSETGSATVSKRSVKGVGYAIASVHGPCITTALTQCDIPLPISKLCIFKLNMSVSFWSTGWQISVGAHASEA